MLLAGGASFLFLPSAATTSARTCTTLNKCAATEKRASRFADPGSFDHKFAPTGLVILSFLLG